MLNSSSKLNPAAMEEANTPILPLAHEALGPGAEGVGGSRAAAQRAESLARSFFRQSGRGNLPYRDAGEMMSEGTMRRLLARLQGRQ